MEEVRSFHVEMVPEPASERLELAESEQKAFAIDVVKSLKGIDVAMLGTHGKEIREQTGISSTELMRALMIVTEFALGEVSEDSRFFLEKKKLTPTTFLRYMKTIAEIATERIADEEGIPPKSQQH